MAVSKTDTKTILGSVAFKQQGRSSIVSYCDRSTKQLFRICLVMYCLKMLVIIFVIVRQANQRAASRSYCSTTLGKRQSHYIAQSVEIFLRSLEHFSGLIRNLIKLVFS